MRTWQVLAELERRAVAEGWKKPDEDLALPIKDFPGIKPAPTPPEQARLPYNDPDDAAAREPGEEG